VDDLIIAVGDTATPDFNALSQMVQTAEGQEIVVVVRRGGETLRLPMRPTLEDVQLPDGTFEKRVIIGVSLRTFLSPQTVTPGPLDALRIGVQQTYGVIIASLDGVRQIVAGNVSPANLQGPVGIAQVSGETASRSGIEFILLIALISTAIGLMNLFPIPMLDGGHLLFNLYEAFAGQQPPDRVREIAGALGLATVLSLMLFATYNDIARLLSTFVS
jgi:regulator of sigma E protease